MLLNFILLYWLVMSLISFIQFFSDKKRAVKKHWRIPEKTLLFTAFIGGAPGALFGMQTFRHKTKHWYFKILIPMFLILQAAAIIFIIYKLYR